MTITRDPNNPRLDQYRRKGHDTEPVEQQVVYLALSEEELAKGYLLPVRRKYLHKTCGGATIMPLALAQTHARDPWFYGGTYCCHCAMHCPLEKFRWDDGEPMSPRKWSQDQLAEVMRRKKQLEDGIENARH